MRYLVIKSEIRVLGTMWMPPGVPAAKCLNINEDHIDEIKGDDGYINRESVLEWLGKNEGDFQTILDFYADIAIDDKDIVINWAQEEAETMYHDCMFPEEY